MPRKPTPTLEAILARRDAENAELQRMLDAMKAERAELDRKIAAAEVLLGGHRGAPSTRRSGGEAAPDALRKCDDCSEVVTPKIEDDETRCPSCGASPFEGELMQ